VPKRNSKQQQRLITTVVTVLIILAILIVQYVQGGLDLGALLSSLTGAPTPTVSAESNGEPGKFDFYILALSWSPDYCATSAGASDPQQCSIGRKLGFVLHGLWPQYNQGYPSNCSTARMPADVKAKFPLLYPSPKLYDHEWEKHGTCTGLTPDAYLTLSQQIKNSVVIPAAYRAPEQPLRVTTAQLKREFTSANPGLREGSLATMCSGSGRYLQELYVCFFSDGTPATCSTEIHRDAARSCGQADFLVRNIK
jgi:ribonuclease T2